MLQLQDEWVGADVLPDSQAGPNSRRPGVVVAAQTPLMRVLLSACLEATGFEVWVAGSGVELLEMYLRHRGEVDVLLAEAELPDLPGPALYDRLQTHLPGIPCCFFSPTPAGRHAAEVRAKGASLVLWPMPPDRLADVLWAEVLAATVPGA